MTTSDLIARLAADLRPVPAGAVWRKLALGLGGGSILSVALMAIWLGLRPDLGEAVMTSAFWLKFAYTALAVACALAAVERLTRPGCTARGAFLAGSLLIAAIILLGAMEFVGAPEPMRPVLFWGGSATLCPLFITALSIPILLGTISVVRGLAPTRLILTGAAVGLLSGAMGALVYSFHCTETSMTFLAIWYSVGMAAVGLLGAIVGRRALRW